MTEYDILNRLRDGWKLGRWKTQIRHRKRVFRVQVCGWLLMPPLPLKINNEHPDEATIDEMIALGLLRFRVSGAFFDFYEAVPQMRSNVS